MDELPYEDLVEIGLRTEFTYLISLCKTSRQFKVLCSDDQFWKAKSQFDFPNVPLHHGYTHLDGYLSTMFINKMMNGHYNEIKKKLKNAVETNNIRLTMILTPIMIKYYNTKSEMFSLDIFIAHLCKKAIQLNSYVILLYFINTLKGMRDSEKFLDIGKTLLSYAVSANNLNMVKFLIAYFKKVNPKFINPYYAYDWMPQFMNNREIQNYIYTFAKRRPVIQYSDDDRDSWSYKK